MKQTNKQKRKIRLVRQNTFACVPSYNIKLYTTTFFDFRLVLIQQSTNMIEKGLRVHTRVPKNGWCGCGVANWSLSLTGHCH